MTINCNL